MKIRYTKGWKYQLDQTFKARLINPFKIKEDFKSQYYSITKDGILTVHRGCCWDGPTWFPDFKWMMIPSLIHDCLHWLIARGIIPEGQNDLIDKELAEWIQHNHGKPWLYKFRARYARRATNLVYQRKGDTKPVLEAP